MSTSIAICSLCKKWVYIDSNHQCEIKPRASGAGEMERPSNLSTEELRNIELSPCPCGEKDCPRKLEHRQAAQSYSISGRKLDPFNQQTLGEVIEERVRHMINKLLLSSNPPDYPYNLTKNDPIHSPSHYTFSKYKVQDVLDEWNLDHYYRVIIQYLVRAGRKIPLGKTPLEAEIEDCEKALWYLSRRINILKNYKQS